MDNENLQELKKTLLWCCIVDVGLFVLSSFCFFIDQMWIPLGFLLGGVFSIINYIVLYWFTGLLLKPFAKRKTLSTSLYLVRMIFFGLGLFICIFLQSKGYKIFFFGTCLASYLVNIVVLIVVNNKNDKKKALENKKN